MDFPSKLGDLKGTVTVNLKSSTGSPKSTVKNTVNTTPKKELFIHHIDVGQGEATLITAVSNGCVEFTCLIDGGRYTRGGGTIARYLRRLNIRVIDLMICTHHDADHIEGLIRILDEEKHSTKKKKISVTKILDRQAGSLFDSPIKTPIDFSEVKEEEFAEGQRFCDYEEPPSEELTAQKKKTDISFKKVSSGEEATDEELRRIIEKFRELTGKRGAVPKAKTVIAYSIAKDPQFKLTCLHVDTVGSEPTQENNYSVALLLEYGHFRYFTGGDLESHLEDGFIPALKGKSHLCAFKCGHHGSRNSTSEKFLKETDARRAFISCGRHSYYHPDSDLINRLCAAKPLKQFFLTNCYYNRQGVNPDYLDQEITLLTDLTNKIKASAKEAVDACADWALLLAPSNTVATSIINKLSILSTDAKDLHEGAEQIGGADDLNLPHVRKNVTTLAANTAKLKEDVNAKSDFTKLQQSGAPSEFSAVTNWNAAFTLAQAKIRRFAERAKAAEDMMKRFDLGVKALEGVKGIKADLVKGVVAGSVGHLGNIVLHITAAEAQLADHEYHIGYWNGAWTWFPQRCADGLPFRAVKPTWDFSPACEIKTLKLDPPWSPMHQWDDVVGEDDVLDFALVTGSSGDSAKKETKTEEIISPKEVRKEDRFFEEAELMKKQKAESTTLRKEKDKLACPMCPNKGGQLLTRTCEVCLTPFLIHRTCITPKLNCGAH